MTTRTLVAAMLAGLVAAGGARLDAAAVRILSTQSASAFLAGRLDEVSVDADGVLALARRAERVSGIDEPFAFSFAALPDGWAVGTGNDGKVLHVSRSGAVSTLLDAAEPVVFALWADPDGTLFAGTSPDGRVYRIAGGKAEEYFAPGETYIWAIARGADGALWVATGTDGRLYRVDGPGQGRVAFDSEETHLRALLPMPGGDVLIGSAPGGLVLRWRAREGSAITLHDSALSEVVGLAPAAGGGAWAAALASEASFLDVAPKAATPQAAVAAAAAETGAPGAEPQPVVIVVEGEAESAAAPAAGSRPAGATGPRSEIVRVGADGRVEQVWTSADETVFALAAEGDRLWAGTGLDGKLYLLDGGRPRVEKDLEERQIVGLAAGEGGPALLTTNAAAVWRFSLGAEPAGTYTSAALDAGQVARFGTFRWRGEAPGGARVRVSFRSGFSAQPDRTWSPWSAPAEGTELSLGAVPRGRYLQYRLELRGVGGVGPRVSATEVSYRQENLRPRIERIWALDAGQVLVPAGFNPAEQVFEPASPNREGIFTTLEPAAPRDERTKTLWKKGYRTLRWKATDANGDELRYRLEVRPDGSEEPGWIEVADKLEDDYYGFDSTVLPDGRYRFRLTASDAAGNDGGGALEGVEVSEPVTVDHTPPVLRDARRVGRGARVTVYDAASPLREAKLSIDGGEWKPLVAADGLVDGQTEELSVEEIPEGARLVLLRLSDAAFNDRTFDLRAELSR